MTDYEKMKRLFEELKVPFYTQRIVPEEMEIDEITSRHVRRMHPPFLTVYAPTPCGYDFLFTMFKFDAEGKYVGVEIDA